MPNKIAIRIAIGIVLVIIVAVAAQKYANRHPFVPPGEAAPAMAPASNAKEHVAPASTAPAPHKP